MSKISKEELKIADEHTKKKAFEYEIPKSTSKNLVIADFSTEIYAKCMNAAPSWIIDLVQVIVLIVSSLLTVFTLSPSARNKLFQFKNSSTKRTALDNFIELAYGKNPPKKSAQKKEAVDLAYSSLLNKVVPYNEIEALAVQLMRSPIPYSTHDLALSLALNFYKKAEYFELLIEYQISARMHNINWHQDGKTNKLLSQIFEENLYKIYKKQV